MINEIIKLAFKLCSIPSVSNHEADILSYLCSWLTERGFIVDKIPVSAGRYNIFAYLKPATEYPVIFCTHLDTVAPFVKPSLDDERGILFGRGSCDAKGIAAAMIYAVQNEYNAGFADLALLFTVGEEEDSDGAKACVPRLLSRGQFLVVGEPTELKAAYAQKGSLVFDLYAEGQEAHSSQPELGDSAIHKLVRDMGKILTFSWPHDERFGSTLVNFGCIDGGVMRNVLANSASAKAIMRTSTANQMIIDEIKRMLSPKVAMTILSSQDPFSFFAPPGFEQFLAAFGSDAPYLRQVAKPMLIGPGSLAYAHRPDEQIRYADLDAGARAYGRIAKMARQMKKDEDFK
jgi:acetylornithine deacetylase